MVRSSGSSGFVGPSPDFDLSGGTARSFGWTATLQYPILKAASPQTAPISAVHPDFERWLLHCLLVGRWPTSAFSYRIGFLDLGVDRGDTDRAMLPLRVERPSTMASASLNLVKRIAPHKHPWFVEAFSTSGSSTAECTVRTPLKWRRTVAALGGALSNLLRPGAGRVAEDS